MVDFTYDLAVKTGMEQIRYESWTRDENKSSRDIRPIGMLVKVLAYANASQLTEAKYRKYRLRTDRNSREEVIG